MREILIGFGLALVTISILVCFGFGYAILLSNIVTVAIRVIVGLYMIWVAIILGLFAGFIFSGRAGSSPTSRVSGGTMDDGASNERRVIVAWLRRRAIRLNSDWLAVLALQIEHQDHRNPDVRDYKEEP